MAYPVAKVSIAFNDGPYVASPTWTDVSSYVRDVSTDRGRSGDWDPFVGFATVVLDNRSRLFDPFYTSGTYYGKLLPRRQIKIEATYGGSTYAVFRGYVAGWPATWTDGGKDATVTLSCFDSLQLLGMTQGPADWADWYIGLSFSPRHYYRMNEPITPFLASQTLADSGSYPQDLSTDVVCEPGPQLYASGATSSLGGQYATVSGNLKLVATGGSTTSGTMSTNPATIAFWALGDSLTQIEFNNRQYWIGLVQNADGTFCVSVDVYSATQALTAKSQDILDFQVPHHIAIVFDTATNGLTIYVDGFDRTGTGTVGGYSGTTYYENVKIWNGNVSQLIIYSGQLTQTTIRDLVNTSKLMAPNKTKDRMKVYFDIGGIPSAMYNVNSSANVNMLDLSGNAAFLGADIQLTANTEAAPVFVDKSGVLQFYNKSTIFTATKSTTSQQTYGSGGRSMGTQIELSYDGDQVRNVINVQMSQGGTQTYTDSTSVTTYGYASMDNATQAASIADANVSGNMYKTLGATPYPTTSPIDVVLGPDESWTSTLGLELCERITVVTAPPAGNSISLPMLVQRIRHHAVPGEWHTTLEGSNRWAQSYTP